MTNRDVELLNPLALAHIGDAFTSLYLREQIIKEGVRVDAIHNRESSCARATAQSERYNVVSTTFDKVEQGVAGRAHNAKINTKAKNATMGQYRRATALEAVIGYNYLIGNIERARELIGGIK